MAKRRALLGAGLAAILVLAAGAVIAIWSSSDDGSPDPDDESLDLVVVGDSFPEQSRDQLLALTDEHGLAASVSAFGGSSICGWWDQLEAYAEDEPEILILGFAGNDLQPCITDDPEQTRPSDEVAEDYRADLETVLEMFRPTEAEIYVVLPPPVGGEFEERAAAMRTMYREAQAGHPDLNIIDSATHLDPEGQGFQATLPCEPWDDCPEGPEEDGEIQVRDEDTIHLTPAGGERYARAVLEGIGVDL